MALADLELLGRPQIQRFACLCHIIPGLVHFLLGNLPVWSISLHITKRFVLING